MPKIDFSKKGENTYFRNQKMINLQCRIFTSEIFFFSLRVNLTPKVFIVPCLSYHHIMLLLSFRIMNCLLSESNSQIIHVFVLIQKIVTIIEL